LDSRWKFNLEEVILAGAGTQTSALAIGVQVPATAATQKNLQVDQLMLIRQYHLVN
jgi:hypothetical protein